MRRKSVWLTLAGTLILAAPALANSESTETAATAKTAETREQYLARLTDVCQPGCMQPRELLRKARKRKSGDAGDMAVILDVRRVSRVGDKYILHTEDGQSADYFDLQRQLDFGMQEFDSRRLGSTSDILIEIDLATLRDLLTVPGLNGAANSAPSGAPRSADDPDILVERDKEQKIKKPKLLDLRKAFFRRRVVARGQPRLDIMFTGARRNFKDKRVTLVVDNADDLVMLPRYDDHGEPIAESLPFGDTGKQP